MPIKVTCSYCGKEFYKKINEVRRSKKHFCCKEHFFSYRKENNYPPVKGGMTHHMKLKILAEKIKNSNDIAQKNLCKKESKENGNEYVVKKYFTE